MNRSELQLLVGDNAFHGISHLSQQRARDRILENNPADIQYASKLVALSIQNGANGFMFSVSETTLGILKKLDHAEMPDLYAIVPYAYEYVRLSTKVGGISGLIKNVSRQIILSRVIFDVIPHLFGLIHANPSSILKVYLIYEISRIKSAAGKNAKLKSVLLHEVITDMALALDMKWLFESYIEFLIKMKIRPGFETRNFPFLVEKFQEWQIDMTQLTITAAFNRIGFQMNPSKLECEKALENLNGPELIAMSLLAAGYLKPSEAFDYVLDLPNVTHAVIGVSKEEHALNTFSIFRKQMSLATKQR